MDISLPWLAGQVIPAWLGARFATPLGQSSCPVIVLSTKQAVRLLAGVASERY